MYLFLISVSAQLGFNLDNVVIGGFIGAAAVAVYSVASRLADYQRQMSSQFNGLLFPIVVDFEARGDNAALRTTLVDGTRLAVGLVGGVTLALVVFARPLIERWMGPGFEQSVPALYALAIAGIALVGVGPLGNVLLVVGRHRLVALGSLGEGVLNLALSIVLVRTHGLVGAAMGTMIAALTVNLLVLLPVACKSLGVPVLEFTRLSLTPSLVAAFPSAVLAWWLRVLVAPASLVSIVSCGAAVGLLYVVSFTVLGLRAADRARYLQFARRLAPWRTTLVTT
jgi:O-antigen/teichoic acid export membrane protein